MRSNKFGCFVVAVVIFVHAVLVSRAVSARVRLIDVDNVVLTSQILHLPASAAGYYRSRDSDIDVGKTLLRLHRKPGSEYRPLVINLLPKGSFPPSGPSKRKNSFS
ncbi:hypothetical protein HRI_000860200 [Hibiscus trionum]|uniref:Uncharacterized protein n=1 Tax=Hibiscus trionum TaxID=183268 RepID=A0A9W7H6H6_HIBTR|nr:hypothetical protein HRI_000860200 [Hibiscus trionum]